MTVLNPGLFWVLIIPFIYALAVFNGRDNIGKYREALSLFINRKSLVPVLLRISAVTLLSVSLLQPVRGYREVTVPLDGKTNIFLIDVSLSMLARDLRPNRLEMTRQAILDLIPHLSGDKVALVLFSGETFMTCPLTTDYAFFRQQVKNMDAGDAGRGGTLIGDALRFVRDSLLPEGQKNSVDLYLFTDGEDQESYPVEAAVSLNEHGVRLIAVGMGTPGEGQPIPVENEEGGDQQFLTWQGEEVRSSLDEETLKKMSASVKGGRYLNVTGGTLDLVSVYRQLDADAVSQKNTVTRKEYNELSPWLIGLAFALLCLSFYGTREYED